MATATAIINQFINETQIGIFGSETGTFAATTLTDTKELQNSNFQGNEFRGYWLGYLDSVTVADRQKPVASNGIAGSTGVLTHGGSNITTTGASKNWTLTQKQWPPVRYLVPLLNRALQMCWLWWREPLSIIPNAGGENSSVGGADTNATTTRDTTAANVFDGAAALKVTLSSANGYHQWDPFHVAQSRSFTLGLFVKVQAGPAVISINAATSGTEIASTTLAASAADTGAYQYVQFSGTIPSNVQQAVLRVGSTSATGVILVDNACIYWEPVTRISGPSWLTQWRDDKGRPLFRLLKQENRISYDGSAPGRAYDWKLVDAGEYQIVNNPAAANAVEVELDRKLSSPAYPLIIEARRSYYSLLSAAIAAGTESTTGPTELVVAAMKRIAANDRRTPQADVEFGGNGAFKTEYEQWQGKYASQLVVPPVGAGPGLAWRKWS